MTMQTIATDTATRTASTTAAGMQKPAREPRNGVNTPTLMATIDAVRSQPELARFQFRATNRWISGTHSRTTMSTFSGAGGEHMHKTAYTGEGDHPAVLCGMDEGPTPVEWVLHALATCLTAGIANIAAARGVTLRSVESMVEGNIDLRGILGLSDEARNGFTSIRVNFAVDGDAPAAKLKEIVQQARDRSAVFDMLTNGLPVSIVTRTAE